MNTYGRIREKKLTTQDMQLQVCNLKNELQREIDSEHRRVNIDSAKKRAVVQHMDYEGFRQMVLGAHLYRMKSKELKDFSIGVDTRNVDKVMNATQTTFNNIQTNDISKDEKNQQLLLLMQVDTLKCNSFREFRTKFQQFYKVPITDSICADIDMLMKSQSPQNLKNIVSIDFQITYFLDLTDVYTVQLNVLLEQQKEDLQIQTCFIVSLLFELSQIKDFKFQVTKFLNKLEKLKVQAFIKLVQQVSENLIKDETLTSCFSEEFPQMLENVVKFYEQ